MPLRAFFLKQVGSVKEKFSVVVWPVIGILVEEGEALVISAGSEVLSFVTSCTHSAKRPSELLLLSLTSPADVGLPKQEVDVVSARLPFGEATVDSAATASDSTASTCVKICTKSVKSPSRLLLMSSISPADKMVDTSHEETPLISIGLPRVKWRDSLIGDIIIASVFGDELVALGELDCFCLLVSR